MIYSFLYAIFYALTLLGGLFYPKLKRAHRDRRGLLERVRALTAGWTPGAWWVHIASSGELEQALPILDALRARFPDDKIFLSYFSPSAKDAVKLEEKRRAPAGRTVPWDGADYSPFDFATTVNGYLDALRPRCFITIHRELWPGVVAGCARRGIPVFLLAASFPRRQANLPGWQRRQLENLSAIGVTREEAALWLQAQVNGPKIRVVGDPRVERVLSRKEMARPAPWLPFFVDQSIFLAASLWPKDYDALRESLVRLKAEAPSWRVILVPHEPKRKFVDFLYADLKSIGYKPRLWSRWLEEPDESCALVVDKVGLLAELYRVSQMVFVGGSFAHRVHNVLEPAAYGCRLFTGPRIGNSLEALELQMAGLLTVAPTAKVLSDALLSAVAAGPASQAPLQEYLAERSKSAAACLHLLTEYQKVPPTF